MFRCASACHPWPKTRRTLMIGLFNYIAVALPAMFGVFLWSMAYWPDPNMAKKSKLLAVAAELRQRRKAFSLAGIGMIMIGVMLIVNAYAERHSASSGVIFIPEFIVNVVLFGATVLMLGGLFAAVVKTARMKKIMAHAPAPIEQPQSVGA